MPCAHSAYTTQPSAARAESHWTEYLPRDRQHPAPASKTRPGLGGRKAAESCPAAAVEQDIGAPPQSVGSLPKRARKAHAPPRVDPKVTSPFHTRTAATNLNPYVSLTRCSLLTALEKVQPAGRPCKRHVPTTPKPAHAHTQARTQTPRRTSHKQGSSSFHGTWEGAVLNTCTPRPPRSSITTLLD